MRPVEPMPADHPMRLVVTEALRTYIQANNALRSHPQGIRSSPPPDNEEGHAYLRLQELYMVAYSNLWMATDFEYEEDGFRNLCWNWRYWKIMARKCCWYQSHGYASEPDVYGATKFRLFSFNPAVDAAAQTMKKLHEAEEDMVEACGLWDIYRSPCSFLEEHFPNLKRES